MPRSYRKKAKTGKRKKRFGRSIKNRCPGYFQSQAKRKFRIYIEVPTDYKASQYNHTSDEYIKKSCHKECINCKMEQWYKEIYIRPFFCTALI